MESNQLDRGDWAAVQDMHSDPSLEYWGYIWLDEEIKCDIGEACGLGRVGVGESLQNR